MLLIENYILYEINISDECDKLLVLDISYVCLNWYILVFIIYFEWIYVFGYFVKKECKKYIIVRILFVFI